jgi:hypothetical protein
VQRDVRRQWHLDDDPPDRRVGVQALDLVADRVGSNFRTDLDKSSLRADLLASAKDLLQVNG